MMKHRELKVSYCVYVCTVVYLCTYMSVCMYF